MDDPEGYKYLQDQGLAKNLGDILDRIENPSEERVRGVFDQIDNLHEEDDHMFYAALYKAIQEVFPFFSSRDVRNIQSAISLRLTDFDLESDWFENPEVYFRKEYEIKLNMLRELMKSNMKGLNFSDIRRQEVIRYLDNVATIADTDFNRKVESRVDQMRVELEARERFDKNDLDING
jgi:hypothetical protein